MSDEVVPGGMQWRQASRDDILNGKSSGSALFIFIFISTELEMIISYLKETRAATAEKKKQVSCLHTSWAWPYTKI